MTQKYTSLSLEIIILQKRNLKARESRITVRSCNQLFLALVLELRSPTSDFGPSFPTIPLRALMGTGLNGYLHIGLLHPCSYYDQVSLLKTPISFHNSLTHSLTSHPFSTGSNSKSSAGLLYSSLWKSLFQVPKQGCVLSPIQTSSWWGEPSVQSILHLPSPPVPWIVISCSFFQDHWSYLEIMSGPLFFFRDYAFQEPWFWISWGFPPSNSPCISSMFVLIILYCIWDSVGP